MAWWFKELTFCCQPIPQHYCCIMQCVAVCCSVLQCAKVKNTFCFGFAWFQVIPKLATFIVKILNTNNNVTLHDWCDFVTCLLHKHTRLYSSCQEVINTTCLFDELHKIVSRICVILFGWICCVATLLHNQFSNTNTSNHIVQYWSCARWHNRGEFESIDGNCCHTFH